ncbi:hypothetical protein HOP50_05g36200 [Chloropicon primus]|uniref:TLC domain-containing protein n=1 Tax=Chloropicon primus TaxID=1764295 RepID=A0A5B8MP38_9CHLO|nr:hypothetical protein A3770_05p36100 [Chloropicon primus]UPR00306.1 hypothetical protein HOP50_05g36200 [Chloropicon primus]|eukprot:QDZ21092.1 hypothetical protein A3770_05p36100 [Chloropicon primus]
MFELTMDVADRSNVNMHEVFGRILHISEYPRAEAADRHRELAIFFEGAVFATLLGIGSHYVYGRITKQDVKTVSSFAMMAMGTYFFASWVSMMYDGRYLVSPGFEAGMCMGYEVYAFIMEFVYLYNGRFRKDFMFHHVLCMFFSVATAYAWVQIPDLDVSYWFFVWRSICYMLGSNFLANARLVHNTNAVNLSFAINFVVSRVYNQMPFVKIALRDAIEIGLEQNLKVQVPPAVWQVLGEGRGKAVMWQSHWTTALVIAWALLVLLNFFWSFKVIQVMYWKLTGQTRSTKKKTT